MHMKFSFLNFILEVLLLFFYEYFALMYVCASHVSRTYRSQKRVGAPGGGGAADSCEIPCGCSEMNLVL